MSRPPHFKHQFHCFPRLFRFQTIAFIVFPAYVNFKKFILLNFHLIQHPKKNVIVFVSL